MDSTISRLAGGAVGKVRFTGTQAQAPVAQETVAALPQDVRDAAAGTADPAPAKESGKKSLAVKLGAAALTLTAVAGGMGMLPGTATPAHATEVYYQCVSDPWQYQDEQNLNHMATLFASPNTGYNRAAGLYDADTNWAGIPNSASELTRLDGDQALKQLSCGHPVRFYAPQTGWLKFHNLDDLHMYAARTNVDGVMPWDMPGVYLGDQYTAGYGSPWYDSDFNRYNDYNAYTFFYQSVTVPTWTYVAPPTFTPPSAWGSSAPPDPFNHGTSAPADPFNHGTSAPADPFNHGTSAPSDPFGGSHAPVHSAPADPFGGSVHNAPADPFGGGNHYTPPPVHSAPADPFGGGGNHYTPPPVHSAPSDPFGGGGNRYTPPAVHSAPADPFGGGGSHYAPAPTYHSAPADPFRGGGGSFHGSGSAPADPFRR